MFGPNSGDRARLGVEKAKEVPAFRVACELTMDRIYGGCLGLLWMGEVDIVAGREAGTTQTSIHDALLGPGDAHPLICETCGLGCRLVTRCDRHKRELK